MPFGVSHTLYRPRSVSDNKFSLLQRRLKSSTPPRCSRNCSLRGEEEGSRMFAGLDGRSLHCDFGTLRCVGNTGRWWFCRNICLAEQGRAGQGVPSMDGRRASSPLPAMARGLLLPPRCNKEERNNKKRSARSCENIWNVLLLLVIRLVYGHIHSSRVWVWVRCSSRTGYWIGVFCLDPVRLLLRFSVIRTRSKMFSSGLSQIETSETT